MRGLTVEEHPLVRHEDVVEDEKAFGHVRAVADGEVAGVFTSRSVRRVDDREPFGIRGHRARNGVVLFARLHALRGQHHLLVHERRARDVHLRSRDHDAVPLTVDHVDVEVRVVLLGRAASPVTLRVGDRLRAPDISRFARLDELVDAVAVLTAQLPERGCDLDEGHARCGRARRDVAVAQRLHTPIHVLTRPRHEVHRMERVGIRVVEAVVGRRNRIDRAREERVARGIADALAVEVAPAAVDERRAVLVPGHHGHRGSSPVVSRWLVSTSIAEPATVRSRGTAAGAQGATGSAGRAEPT